jgi:hypothetical protein
MSPAHVIVDVFTDTPLQGNHLAVSEDRSALSDDQMQRLAREMICPRPSSCFRPRRVHHKGPATGAGASRFFSQPVVRRIAPNWIICARKAAAVHEPG